MWVKAIVCVMFATVTAMALLAIRQQRIVVMNRTASYHHQIQQHGQTLWSLQTDIASQLRPDRLQEAIKQADLELAPTTPLDNPDSDAVAKQPTRRMVRSNRHIERSRARD